jgi:hypothetical protein
MKKYIFLDVDGVLNGNHSISKYQLFPNYLNNLKILVNETKAMIVLSSSWRNFFHKENDKLVANFPNKRGDLLLKELSKLNLEIFDTTKLGYSSTIRGEEIKEWLDINAPKNYKYIILDDDNDMLEEQLNNFIQTKFDGLSINDEGLNDKILKKSIIKLNY